MNVNILIIIKLCVTRFCINLGCVIIKFAINCEFSLRKNLNFLYILVSVRTSHYL